MQALKLRPLGIAIWFVACSLHNKKVLLQPQEEKLKIGRMIVHQPIKAWVRNKELGKDTLFRTLHEELGESFARKFYCRLRPIDKKPLSTKRRDPGDRWHFRCEITEEELTLLLELKRFTVVNAKSLSESKIKKWGKLVEVGGKIFYEDDYEVLMKSIINLQTRLTVQG